MNELVDVIANELTRQAIQGNSRLTVGKLPISEREPGSEGFFVEGEIDLTALALAIETAQGNSEMGQIRESIRRGARRVAPEKRFKL